MNIIKYFYHIIRLNGLHLYPTIFEHYKIYKLWKKINSSKKNLIDLELPWITVAAKYRIDSYLEKIDNPKIFEFGAGGSSLYFLKKNANLYSVEHDKIWFDQLNKLTKKTTKWTLKFIPPSWSDKNTEYSSEFKGYEKANFFDYVHSIDAHDENYFDIILVDGRSRLACLKHSKNKVKIGGLLILDNAERDRYFKEQVLTKQKFKLIFEHYGALIGSYQFVKTNIYQRIS